jgi:high-affinity nickel-transport protein
MFLVAWGLSVGVWKFGRIEQRYSMSLGPHSHPHVHEGGLQHTHDHLHPHAK